MCTGQKKIYQKVSKAITAQDNKSGLEIIWVSIVARPQVCFKNNNSKDSNRALPPVMPQSSYMVEDRTVPVVCS